jgi:hypothetical protein
MPEPIQEYQVYAFPTPFEASETGARIMDFIHSPGGIGWMLEPMRAVIWTGPTLDPEGSLYLSPGAVEAARAAGVGLRAGQKRSAKELPAGLTLLLGESIDSRR